MSVLSEFSKFSFIPVLSEFSKLVSLLSEFSENHLNPVRVTRIKFQFCQSFYFTSVMVLFSCFTSVIPNFTSVITPTT